ncbi:Peptidyl-prolyl cis-tran isomerase-like 3 [Taenia solium]|eukprot:TsM_000540400 transcript=TsM_000540400 gene=TsM_000540400
MNLSTYLECARRCVCLTVAPASLPRVLTLFQEASANLERAYYWQNSRGLLLLQSRSQAALHKALRQIRIIPRAYLPNLVTNGSTERFNLPPYRICSDPSIWPVSSASEKYDETLVQFLHGPSSPSALEKLLLQQHSVLDQMQKLVDRTILCHSFRLALFTFSDSLAEILSTIRPGSSVYPFGSAINGLGSNSSDLDAVVNLGFEIPPRLRSFAQFCSRSVANLHQYPSSGLSIMHELLNYNGQTNYHTLTPVRYLLKRLDPLSGSGSRVLPGRTPIINYARHRCLGVGVDISCSSGDLDTTRLVLHAAYWMRALVTQVPAFLYLASALKFLMRGVHITHHGPSFGFTNYKLTSLLVSFLQVAVGMAPPLEYLLLQDECSIPERIFISCEEHPHCPAEAPDLLLEFFSFLRAQQPEKSTFCLRSGRVLPREGQTIQGHFLHCPNPLVPERNITHGIGAEAWREFLDVIDHMEHVLLEPRPKSGVWGLPAMMKSIVRTGKNGQSIWKQKFKDEFDDALKHNTRGIVSMANNGPDSNGSQFFITYSKQTMLDMKYSIFGKVIDGWDVLDELERAPVEDKTYKPLTDIHIQDITIHANPFAE